MKNKAIILVLFLTTIIFSSCKDFNKEVLGDDSIPVESVEKPSIEKIKNDLLGKEIKTWIFAKIEEFNSVNITNSRILDDLNLEIEASLDLSDYETGKPYKGNIVVSYYRMANNSSSWEFKEVSGTVYKVESDASDEKTNQEEYQSQQQTERNYPICDRCGNEIRGTVYYVNSLSGSVGSIQYIVDLNDTTSSPPYHQNCAEEEADYKTRNN